MRQILVVENEPQDRQLVVSALTTRNVNLAEDLEARGIEYPTLKSEDIIETDNAQSAMEAIDESGEDLALVLLDLQIPGKTVEVDEVWRSELHGFEVLAHVRATLGTAVPVVLLSMYLDVDDADQRRGYQKYLDILDAREIPPPDDILQKGAALGGGGRFGLDSDLLQRKVVPYLMDLTSAEEALLKGHNIPIFGPSSRRVLRQLKRYALSVCRNEPLPSVLLQGENGVGKTTFARAYHLLRRPPEHMRLGFNHVDLGSLDFEGSAPHLQLFGATDFNDAWSLGAFVQSTLYRRGGAIRLFPRQVVEDAERRDGAPTPGQPSGQANDYPQSIDEPDFDGSGTLFLDEVVNTSQRIQAMLLQALGYDLRRRHVSTTGTEQRRLRVGPAVICATRRKILPGKGLVDEGNEKDRPTWAGLPDYLFRIDQRRVEIPPLRERREEIEPALKQLIAKRRREAGYEAPEEVTIEPNVKEVLMTRLAFPNNMADLARIVDHVGHEERSISWRHVRELYLWEKPLVPRVELRGEAWDRAQCTRYLEEVERSGVRRSLADIERDFKTIKESAYRVGLLVIEKSGGRWPKKQTTLKLFGTDVSSFRTNMYRFRPDKDADAKPAAIEGHLANLAQFR